MGACGNCGRIDAIAGCIRGAECEEVAGTGNGGGAQVIAGARAVGCGCGWFGRWGACAGDGMGDGAGGGVGSDTGSAGASNSICG